MTSVERPPKQEQQEATAEVTEVAPGVVRTQLPVNLPGLGHVNCYVMEDERGIAVVDPGLPGPDSWAALTDRLARAGYRTTDVHTVVITHSHFDHFGGAVRLRDESGAEVVTHESFRVTWHTSESREHEDSAELEMRGPEAREEAIARFFDEPLPWGGRRTPPPPEAIERMRKMGRFSDGWQHTPRPSVAVADGQTVSLARREWTAIHTPGHTYDHLCLYDAEHGVVLTGDHVLPTITPHISGMSPEPDPLALFFESLRRMADVDDVAVALPAHGHPFTDLGGRALDIIDHHDARLETIRTAAHEVPDGTVNDYMRILFRERAWGDMAESETYAHLEHLHELGELTRHDEDGFARYHPVD